MDKRDKKREIKCKKAESEKGVRQKGIKVINKQVASRESDKERSETKVKGSGEQKRPKE